MSSDVCCVPVLFLCAFVAEHKLLIPSLKMLVVSFVIAMEDYVRSVHCALSFLHRQLFVLLGLSGVFGSQVSTQARSPLRVNSFTSLSSETRLPLRYLSV